MCRGEAERLIRAFTSGEPMPEVDAVDEAQIPRGGSRALRGGGGRACPLYITTVPASDAASTVEFTIRPAREDREAIVPGCRDARG